MIAMSPPLTMGLTGRLVAWSHRAPQVFNIQDVFPDAAVETGAITNRRVIAVASWLERVSYRLADAVTVLSDDLRANVAAKVPAARAATVHTIPNFVDTDRIRPADRMTPYRAELGIGAEPVVLYAGNVGFSQSLDLLVEAARRLPDVTFLINGDGAARPSSSAAPPGCPTCASPGSSPRTGSSSCWPPVTSTPCRCGAGWRGQRAVEDVLDPRRRSPGRRRHRRRHRGAADARRVGRRHRRPARRPGPLRRRRRRARSTTRRGPGDGRAGGSGSLGTPRRPPSPPPTRTSCGRWRRPGRRSNRRTRR